MTHWRDVMTEEEALELAGVEEQIGHCREALKICAARVRKIRNRCTLRIRYKKFQEANNGK